MNRVFCATSWELEGERRAFYDVVSEFNQATGLARELLYVPVSLTNVRDKRPLQYTIEENVRESFAYVLVLTDGWGPAERNFERDFRLALECQRDPALPMRHVALLWQRPPDHPPFLADVEQRGVSPVPFDDTAGFRREALRLLSEWVESA